MVNVSPTAGVVLVACLIAPVFPLDTLYLNCLISLSGNWDGSTGLLAVEMAVEDVNMAEDVLPGITLIPRIFDSEGRASTGIPRFFEVLQAPHQAPVIIGTSCSSSCIIVGSTAHYWNIVMISPSSSGSTQLDDTARFPTFFRNIQSQAYAQADAFVAFLATFGWRRIAAVYDEAFRETVEIMKAAVSEAGVEIVVEQTGTISNDIAFYVRSLKNKDVRIINTMVYIDLGAKLLCEAKKQGMIGPRYVWIFTSWLLRNLESWRAAADSTECSADEVVELLRTVVSVDLDLSLTDRYTQRTISGHTVKELEDRIKERKVNDTRHAWQGDAYAQHTYDSVWTAALALNTSLHLLDNYTFDTGSEVAQSIVSAIKNTSYYGMTGLVRFNDHQRLSTPVSGVFDRLDGPDDKLVPVAKADGQSTVMRWVSDRRFLFSADNPPRDGRLESQVEHHTDRDLQLALSALAALGIMYAIILLCINVINRKRKIIKLSSPSFNNVVALGSILCFNAAILYSVDNNTVDNDTTVGHVCMIRAWILSVGFTLTFGGLFVKTWRVYVIFSNMSNPVAVNIRDSHLFGLLLIGLIIDIVIMTIWTVLDPLTVHRRDLQPQIFEEEDMIVYPFIKECTSQSMYIYVGVVYLYKGLLLIYGAFLAYETRKVKIPHLNDSKVIGVAIYNVFILCAIGAPLVAFIENQKDLTFALVGLFVIVGAAFVISMVFIPKIIQLRRNDAVINVSTMGSATGHASMANAKTDGGLLNLQLKKVTNDAKTLANAILKNSITDDIIALAQSCAK